MGASALANMSDGVAHMDICTAETKRRDCARRWSEVLSWRERSSGDPDEDGKGVPGKARRGARYDGWQWRLLHEGEHRMMMKFLGREPVEKVSFLQRWETLVLCVEQRRFRAAVNAGRQCDGGSAEQSTPCSGFGHALRSIAGTAVLQYMHVERGKIVGECPQRGKVRWKDGIVGSADNHTGDGEQPMWAARSVRGGSGRAPGRSGGRSATGKDLPASMTHSGALLHTRRGRAAASPVSLARKCGDCPRSGTARQAG